MSFDRSAQRQPGATRDGFFLGTQYFRPPFPRDNYWEEDLRRIRDAGLDTIVCWLVWGWCEPEPGRFVFDDYHRLIDLAAAQDLKVVLSALPEVNPFWVPRVLPEASMIDVHGQAVIGGPRLECLSGLTPGGCSDHPQMRAYMERFLERCGAQFANCANLRAWDVWNENRWRNSVDGSVCFCPHSLQQFRQYLARRYGSLDALGEAWGRRYADWSDVRIGPQQSSCYPEMHDFLGWLSERNSEMIRWRLAALRRGDSKHLVGSHTSSPSICGGVALKEDIFARGVDWDIAAGDFYGLSVFPDMSNPKPIHPLDIAGRYTAAASAAPDRPCWLNELQGGPVTTAGRQSPPLHPDRQQAWVWLAVARGLSSTMFWCWRPEVFGLETGGFGVVTPDGLAAERLTAIRDTADELALSGVAAHGFRPASPQVGVLFQRDAYWLHWMRSREYAPVPYEAPEHLLPYLRSLDQLHTPYTLLDDRHVDQWRQHRQLKLIVVPDAAALSDEAAEALLRFAQDGGSVWVEGVAGQIGPTTFQRPDRDCPLMRGVGAEQTSCRSATDQPRTIPQHSLGNAEAIEVYFDRMESSLRAVHGKAHVLSPDDLPGMVNVPVGRGHVAVIGGPVARTTWRVAPDQLLNLTRALLGWADVRRELHVRHQPNDWCAVSRGHVGDRPVLLLVNFGRRQRVDVAWDASLGGTRLHDAEGRELPVRVADGRVHLSIEMDPWVHKLLICQTHTSDKATEAAASGDAAKLHA